MTGLATEAQPTLNRPRNLTPIPRGRPLRRDRWIARHRGTRGDTEGP